MKQKKFRVIGIALLIIISGIILCKVIHILNTPNVYVYNMKDKSVYLKNSNEVILQNVYAPTYINSNRIVAVFLDEQPSIGIYDVESGESHVLFSATQLSQCMEQDINVEEIKNIQIVPDAENKVSFIYGDNLYVYDTSGEIKRIWKFAEHYSDNPYVWADDTQLLILDELGVLDEWKLYLYDSNNGVTKEMEEKVSAICYSGAEIIYGKKNYEGSWCEWDVHFMDLEQQKTREPITSRSFDIGEIRADKDNEIYFMESSVYSTGQDRNLYRIEENIFQRTRVLELEENEILIGVY